MVERELVLRKLAELELYQRQVSEFREITVERYRVSAGPRRRLSCLYVLRDTNPAAEPG